jgi:hypothetical protein
MTAKKISENSKLSGSLTTFVKQGAGPKMGQCGLDSIIWLNHVQGHE